MTRQVPATPSTRDWLAAHSTVEELQRWGEVTVRALADLIDNLEGNEPKCSTHLSLSLESRRSPAWTSSST